MYIRKPILACAAALTTLAACQHTDPTPADRKPAAETRDDCTPHGLENERLRAAGIDGLGMDICDDGRVVNWDGNDAGQVMARDGNRITVLWRPGHGGAGYTGTDTVIATPVECRMSGTPADC